MRANQIRHIDDMWYKYRNCNDEDLVTALYLLRLMVEEIKKHKFRYSLFMPIPVKRALEPVFWGMRVKVREEPGVSECWRIIFPKDPDDSTRKNGRWRASVC